jgi:hypothetical protein
MPNFTTKGELPALTGPELVYAASWLNRLGFPDQIEG